MRARLLWGVLALAGAGLAAALAARAGAARPEKVPVPPPRTTMSEPGAALETATLGGGCFWCLEALFERVAGVVSVAPGYSGGHVPNPSYEDVCRGDTGHAEVVEIRFDPAVISYHDLLRLFFGLHDPTTLNRQGADVGEQYRSVIFGRTPEQLRVAREVVAELERERIFRRPIVTKIEPFQAFYPAEEYHRRFFDRNQGHAYCRLVIDPEVKRLRREYNERLKPEYR